MVGEEHIRATKIEALRRDIEAGLASGPAEPHDMAAIKDEARAFQSGGIELIRVRSGYLDIAADDFDAPQS